MKNKISKKQTKHEVSSSLEYIFSFQIEEIAD